MTTETPDFFKIANILVISPGKQRWKRIYGRVKQDSENTAAHSEEVAATKMGYTYQIERTFLVGKGFENPGFCKLGDDICLGT